MKRPYVALDVETTGLEAGKDELIEVAAVRFQGGEELGVWHSLLKPAAALPEAITRLTGITPADLEEAPFFYQILPALARFLGDDPIVGHSVEFDLSFLAAQGLSLHNPRLDTYELSTLLLPGLPDRTLGGVARSLGLAQEGEHRALDDARTVRGVFQALWERLAALGLDLLEEIVRQSQKVDWSLRDLFEDVLGEALREGFGRKRADGRPLAARLVAPERRPEPLEETTDDRPLDVERLAGLLAPGGLFARAFPHYEHRPQQMEMLRAVANTLNQGGQLIVEAGTGTGKSVAYLIPALALAVRRGKRVLVSTNTINLQDQLFYKDIPDLQRMLAQAGAEEADLAGLAGFRAALLKGRNNYLCLRRWERLRRSPDLKPEEVRTLVKVLLWLPQTQTGDRAELTLSGPEYRVWDELASDPAACQGSDCTYQQRDCCFFYRARRQAEAAHLLVVNHSLLLSDVVAENLVLPEYAHLIVDEAHHLEGVATDQMGFAVTARDFQAHLAAISWPVGADRESGLLAFLPAFFRGEKVPPAARQTMEGLRKEVRSAVENARLAGEAFFRAVQEFVLLQQEEQSPSHYDRQLRITSGLRIQPDWGEIEIAWERVSEELLRLYERLGRLYQLCSKLAEEDEEEIQDLLFELAALGRRTADIQHQVTAIVSESRRNDICWISVRAQDGAIGLHLAPLHVGERLQEGLYRKKEALVLTSATLSIAESTSFLRERLGLPDAEELLLDSPFDYRRAALLLIPEDIPPPNDPTYYRLLSRTLIQTCQASEGRALVLFTSHYALRETYKAIRRPLEREGIAVLGQGLDGSRHVLLEQFRRNPRSVLLGTSSFWEGIDVVGEGLSLLVIAKLPFSVPSDPIFASRCELFDDPFFQYAVPQSVLRFKQGFGRLIRSKTDRGVVLTLDQRLLTRTYGTLFLESLPDCTVRQVRLLAVPQLVRRWLRGG